MSQAVKTAIAILFFVQAVPFLAFAGAYDTAAGDNAEGAAPDARNWGPAGGASESKASEGQEEYDVSGTVRKARENIAAQKRELESKAPLAKDEVVDKDEVEARREVYQQEIIQDIEMRQPRSALEMSLEREKLRRDIMAEAGREAEVPFRIRRQFNLRLSDAYDDNIYSTKANKKDDHISKIAPSFLVSLNSKYISFDANYIMEYTRYEHREDQGGLNHLINLYIKPGSVKLPFFRRKSGKIGFTLQDDFQPFVTSVATSEQTSRTERTTNRALLTMDYYMSAKRTLSLEYKNNYEKYDTSSMQSFSYNENNISPDIYFHVSPKWSLFTGYEYGRIDYFEGGTNSSNYQNLKGGVTGRLLKKIITRAEIGQQWRHYTKTSDKRNISKTFFKSAFLNRFTPSTKGSIEFDHTIEEATYSGNEYYISNKLDINFDHGFTYKTKGNIGLKLTRNNYDEETIEDSVTKKRVDILIEPKIGIKYFFRKWISADMDYIFKKRISNFNKFGYVDNRVTVALNIGF